MKSTTPKKQKESSLLKSNITTPHTVKINIDTFYPGFSYKNSKGEVIAPKNSFSL